MVDISVQLRDWCHLAGEIPLVAVTLLLCSRDTGEGLFSGVARSPCGRAGVPGVDR